MPNEKLLDPGSLNSIVLSPPFSFKNFITKKIAEQQF